MREIKPIKRENTESLTHWDKTLTFNLVFFVVCFPQIRSDKDTEAKVAYYLTGEGANKPPFNLFVVDPNTGFVRITGIVDREEHSKFHVSHYAVLNMQASS